MCRILNGGLDVRVLVDKRRAVVDLVVDDEVEVFLGVVGGDLLEGEFFLGHFVGVCGYLVWCSLEMTGVSWVVYRNRGSCLFGQIARLDQG